jgi:hypothetical protein
MVKRLSSIILLLVLYINSSLVVPQVDEFDVYTPRGELQDDINSMVDFVDQLILDFKADNTSDEDDDFAHFNILDTDDPYTKCKTPSVLSLAVSGNTEICSVYDDSFERKHFSSIHLPPPEPFIPMLAS